MTIGHVEIFLTHAPHIDRLRDALTLEILQIAILSLLFIFFLYYTLHQALLKPMQSLLISRRTLEAMDEAVVVTDPNNKVIDVNPAYTEITGYTRDEVLGKDPNITSSKHHTNEFYKQMWETIHDKGVWMGEILDRHKNGMDLPVWATINSVKNDRGELLYHVGVFRDITERKQAEKQLKQLAYFDTLTNLPNRMLFREKLGGEISLAKRRSEHLGLFFIDLDKFKHINDTLGHHVGDQLLTIIAGRLKSRLRESDTVSRLGGDEFTIIVPAVKEYEKLADLALELIEEIKQPVILEGTTTSVTASVGIAVFPKDGENPGDLSKHADMAMYEAKGKGRNQYHYYSPEIHQLATKRAELKHELKNALLTNEFVLYYQPQVDLRNNRIVGCEALIRWEKDGSLILPDEFIEIAEESELVIEMGEWVIEHACQEIARWKETGWENLSLAINLSRRQLHQRGFSLMLDNLIKKYAIAPHSIELEITESAIIEDLEESLKTLNELKQLGIAITMDDFGTGYSSLSYLKILPVDILKIDRSFIHEIPDDEDGSAIVSAILSMARSLKLTVVAEGIEHEKQLDYLNKNGCHIGQGYLFHRPLPADEFRAVVSSQASKSVKIL